MAEMDKQPNVAVKRESAREPKNIVLCCDGTGNEFGSELTREPNGKRRFENNNSNVVRLYTCLKVGERQVAYYHPGVGTMGSPTSRNRAERWWSQLKGMGFGLGFTENIADAYRFLMENYADGDRIYLFGFSRGAYTVRALAGALSLYGLLCPGNEGHLSYLLRMYAQASKEAFNLEHTVPRRLSDSKESRAFRESFSRTVPIHFVGVWDTVSSVGWIWDPVKLLHDGQNPIVRKGRHAISVDERRCFFQAMPWGKPMHLDHPMTEEDREKLTTALAPSGWTMQDIVQAWFPGVHSDVGGSYCLEESAPSLVAFDWMLNEARQDDLLIDPERESAIKGQPSKYEGIRAWNHPQPKADWRFHESLHGSWRLLEVFPHKYFDYKGKKRWQLEPWPHSREIPDGSLMHPAVEHRFRTDPQYRPKNLPQTQMTELHATNGPELYPGVRDELISKGYRVFSSTGKHAAEGPAKTPKLAAAACALVGMAAYLLARLKG